MKTPFNLSLQTRLLIIIVISTSFFVIELIVGFRTHSLALTADAFHYIGDVLGFVGAWWVLRGSKQPSSLFPSSLENKPKTDTLSSIVAFFNSVFLLGLGFGIFLQGIGKFIHVTPVENPQLVLAVASIGLFLNITSALVLGHGAHDILHPGHNHASPQIPSAQPLRPCTSSTSSNISALPTFTVTPMSPLSHPAPMSNERPHSLLSFSLLLHILGDAANNIAVMVSSLIIWRVPNHIQGRFYADPAVTVLIALGIMVGAGWGSWKCGKGMLRLLENGGCEVKDGEDVRRRDGAKLATGRGELVKMNGLADVEKLQPPALEPPSPVSSQHNLTNLFPSFSSGPPLQLPASTAKPQKIRV